MRVYPPDERAALFIPENKSPMPRRTKIVATLGPASSDKKTLAAMIDAGLDVVDIGDRKGTTMSVQDVLVSFSSFVGRIEIEGDEIRVTPDLPNMQR